jgi:hypothetical protein
MQQLKSRAQQLSHLWLMKQAAARQQGKVGWILLWLLGVPIPVLLVLFLLRGCT